MTISKGSDWGSAYVPTGTEPVVTSDRELAAIIRNLRTAKQQVSLSQAVACVRGGDLFRALGGQPAPTPMLLPLDCVEITLEDGTEHLAVAHVIARSWLWSGTVLIAMNGSHSGRFNFGPKAHPNDGLIDVTVGALDIRERLKARRRALTGTHVPHPLLATRRVEAYQFEAPRPAEVFVDGARVGRSRRVSLRCVPDAVAIYL